MCIAFTHKCWALDFCRIEVSLVFTEFETERKNWWPSFPNNSTYEKNVCRYMPVTTPILPTQLHPCERRRWDNHLSISWVRSINQYIKNSPSHISGVRRIKHESGRVDKSEYMWPDITSRVLFKLGRLSATDSDTDYTATCFIIAAFRTIPIFSSQKGKSKKFIQYAGTGTYPNFCLIVSPPSLARIYLYGPNGKMKAVRQKLERVPVPAYYNGRALV